MDFSLVFATRGRVDLLEGLFKSLAETTVVPNAVEVIPVVDDDDAETVNAVDRLTELLPGFSVSFRIRPRSKMLNEDYINWGARSSSGQFVFVLNDDVVFKTGHWDRNVLNKLNSYLADKPDRIVYGLTDDGMDSLREQQKLEYTGFPIISRESINVLGYAMPPSFFSWGADIDLFSVYKSAGRVCNLKSEVLVFHLSPHTNTRETDDTNRHVADISTQRNGKFDIPEDIKKLRNYINKSNPNFSAEQEKKPKNKQHIVPIKNLVADRYLKRISSVKRKK